MLLFIRDSAEINENVKPRFNTSHVVIYLKFQQRDALHKFVSIHLMLLFIVKNRHKKAWRILVSIHLMLLFIREDTVSSNGVESFQYISCCYLSS